MALWLNACFAVLMWCLWLCAHPSIVLAVCTSTAQCTLATDTSGGTDKLIIVKITSISKRRLDACRNNLCFPGTFAVADTVQLGFTSHHEGHTHV